MDEDFRGDVDFLRAREEALLEELLKSDEASSEPLTEANINRIVSEVTDALDQSGNHPLAERYLAALTQFRATLVALDSLNSAGEVDERARNAMNGALEDFERVQGEATAWFDSFDEKGGA